jgi:hypothetical protein
MQPPPDLQSTNLTKEVSIVWWIISSHNELNFEILFPQITQLRI